MLAIAILGGGYYIVKRIHTKNEIYKLSSIKNNTDGSLGVYKVSSVKNDTDGRLKYQYNVLAYRYEVYKHDYEIIKNHIDELPNDYKDKEGIQRFWDKYHSMREGFNSSLAEKYGEDLGVKFCSYDMDKLPFSPSETTLNRERETKKFVSDVSTFMTYGAGYKDSIKAELIPRYEKTLDSYYDQLDSLHMKISNM